MTIYTILAELPQWRLVVQQWIASTRTLLPAISCDGWSADLTGTSNPATITIDANKTVIATFDALSPAFYALTGRRNPTRYDTIVDLHLRPSREKQVEVCASLLRGGPDIEIEAILTAAGLAFALACFGSGKS